MKDILRFQRLCQSFYRVVLCTFQSAVKQNYLKYTGTVNSLQSSVLSRSRVKAGLTTPQLTQQNSNQFFYVQVKKLNNIIIILIYLININTIGYKSMSGLICQLLVSLLFLVGPQFKVICDVYLGLIGVDWWTILIEGHCSFTHLISTLSKLKQLVNE